MKERKISYPRWKPNPNFSADQRIASHSIGTYWAIVAPNLLPHLLLTIMSLYIMNLSNIGHKRQQRSSRCNSLNVSSRCIFTSHFSLALTEIQWNFLLPLCIVNKTITESTYGKTRASSSKLSCQQVKQSKHTSIQTHGFNAAPDGTFQWRYCRYTDFMKVWNVRVFLSKVTYLFTHLFTCPWFI